MSGTVFRCEPQENCLDLIEYVAMKTTLRRKGRILGKLVQAAKALAAAAKPDISHARKAK
jgi:hypothetical protein